MGFRQIFGGSTTKKYLTDGVPSNIWGVYSPQIFHGTISVKCFGGVDPPNISRMGFRELFGGSTAPKYLTDGVPSNIWGLYTPKNISRNHIREIFWGCRPPKFFTVGVPSNIWGLYTPKIFDGWGSVKYLGAVDPPNI